MQLMARLSTVKASAAACWLLMNLSCSMSSEDTAALHELHASAALQWPQLWSTAPGNRGILGQIGSLRNAHDRRLQFHGNDHDRRLHFHELDPSVERVELGETADALQVPIESVTSWAVKTWLTPAQACLSSQDVQDQLLVTFADYMKLCATPITQLDILRIHIENEDEDCDQGEGAGADQTAGRRAESYSSATAECLTVIVFGGDQPTFNTVAFKRMAGILSISKRTVHESIAINETFYPPHGTGSDADALSENDGSWMRRNVALVAGAAGGVCGLCAAGVLLLSWRRKRAAAAATADDPDRGLAQEGGPRVGQAVDQGRGRTRGASRRGSQERGDLLRAAAELEIGDAAAQLEMQGRGPGASGGGVPEGLDLVLGGADEERIMEQLRETARRMQEVPPTAVPDPDGELTMRDVIPEVRAKTLKEVEEEVKLEMQRHERGEPPPPSPQAPASQSPRF